MSESKNMYEVTLYNDEIIVITEPVDLWRAIGISDSVRPWPTACDRKNADADDPPVCKDVAELILACPKGCNCLLDPGELHPDWGLDKNINTVKEFNNVMLANTKILHTKMDFLELYMGYAHVFEKDRLFFFFDNGFLPWTSILYVRVLPL